MSNYRGLSAAILGVGFALVQIQTAQALSKTEISTIAKSFTVMIQDAQNPQSSGSGVIIKREGQTYTVLTAGHVVKSTKSFMVMTPDDQKHPMTQGSIQTFPNVDLAVIKFTSAQSYGVAKIGDSAQSPSGAASFVAGFPGTTAVRTEPSFYFTSGEIAANANKPLADGYAIAYNNPTLPGMSGGPVLNDNGELIGIHGRAENAAVPQNAKIREDVYVLKTEFNYAVPINTFLRLSPQVNKTLAFAISSRPVITNPKADDYFLQADMKLKLGDAKGAIVDYTEAIQINPNYGEAYAGRGSALYNINEKLNAMADYQQVIRISPSSAVAYAVRGIIRFEEKDYKSAISALDTALRINPNYTDAFIIRGVAKFGSGDKQGAIQDYDQAIRLNSNAAIAYFNRGLAQSGSGNKQGAMQDYNRAIQVNPNFAIAYFSRGGARLDLGDKQGAIVDYEQAAKLAQQQNNQALNQTAQFMLQSLKF